MNRPADGRDLDLATRRDWLLRMGGGFGALALSGLIQQDDARAGSPADGTGGKVVGVPGGVAPPLARTLPAKAKSVIFLFMEGGPSHIDLFDPKPLLNDLAGKPLPPSFKPVVTPMGEFHSPVLASKRKWKRHGEGGLWISDWLPHMAGCADDLCVIRSCWGNGLNHVGGVTQMNTGSILAGRPSLGAWASYGLGSENADLPGFVVILDNPKATVAGGPRNWGAGFMPAGLQGTPLRAEGDPIANLTTPESVGESRQRAKLDLLGRINARHAAARPDLTELDARLAGYELAYRMQAEAPDAVDLASESKATRALYGLDDEATAGFGRNCLLARRLVERGVRFVQLYAGAGSRWDAHADIEGNHSAQCRAMDRPVAGLLRDLKARGLLDTTLVVWGGEFGRTPQSEKGNGRDHNPYGFTMCLAGGGVAGGRTVGSTDEVGLHAVEDRLHIHDFHATILALLGLDHTKLIFRHKGRPERPTVNEGTIATQIVT
jgi:hypothetical protein